MHWKLKEINDVIKLARAESAEAGVRAGLLSPLDFDASSLVNAFKLRLLLGQSLPRITHSQPKRSSSSLFRLLTIQSS